MLRAFGRGGSWQLVAAVFSLGLMVGAHSVFEAQDLFAEESGGQGFYFGGEGGGEWPCEEMTLAEFCNCPFAVWSLFAIVCERCVEDECVFFPERDDCSLRCTCYGCQFNN